jgi:hypothetical protein
MVKGNRAEGHHRIGGIKMMKDRGGGHGYVLGLCLRNPQGRGHMSHCHLWDIQIIIKCKGP